MDTPSLFTITQDTEENPIPENITLKERAVICLSILIFNDEKMLTEAIDFCLNKGKEMTSMEEYVSDNFSTLITKFPTIQKEYIKEVKLKNKKKARARKNLRRAGRQ